MTGYTITVTGGCQYTTQLVFGQRKLGSKRRPLLGAAHSLGAHSLGARSLGAHSLSTAHSPAHLAEPIDQLERIPEVERVDEVADETADDSAHLVRGCAERLLLFGATTA